MGRKKFSKSGTFYVYILRCQDGTFYTGYTSDLERRMRQHRTGKGGARYTKWKKVVSLVWKREYRRFKPAFLMEKRIKKLTRIQKEDLVNGKRLERVLALAGK